MGEIVAEEDGEEWEECSIDGGGFKWGSNGKVAGLKDRRVVEMDGILAADGRFATIWEDFIREKSSRGL